RRNRERRTSFKLYDRTLYLARVTIKKAFLGCQRDGMHSALKESIKVQAIRGISPKSDITPIFV
ncbi:MAG: hypothetical protein Q7J68_03095, partial [Thermoplasmata archaeon]|nr:hypothetical protein [Thermoplasmata archaeon]